MKKLLCAAALALSLGCLSPSLAVQAADAGTPQAGKAQAEVSDLKREVFRLQQKLEKKG